MREVLFRGKDYSGNWVYGYLVHGKEVEGNKMPGYYIIEDNFSVEDSGEFYHKLSQVTCVGQWTGWCDKNGQKIFEGDIIEPDIFTINYKKESKAVKKIVNVVFEDGAFKAHGCKGEGYYLASYFCNGYKVIGNIHDNPELLEGGD